VQRLINALLSNRRRREIIAVLIFLLLLLPQVLLSISSGGRAGARPDRSATPSETVDNTRRRVVTAGQYLAWLPPGLAARNLTTGEGGLWVSSWLALLAAAGFAFAIGALEYRKLIRDYYGPPPASGKRSDRQRQTGPAEGKGAAAFNDVEINVQARAPAAISRFSLLDDLFPWLPVGSTAVLEKEIKYLYRSPRAFLVFIGPVLATMILIMPNRMGRLGGKVENYRLAIIVLYSILLDTQFFSNAFGFDWHGAKLYFMSPIKGRSVLIGKNLAAVLIIFVQVAAIAVIFRVLAGPLEPAAAIDALFAFGIATPLSLTLGNYLSVLYPRAVDFSKVFGRSYSNVSQFAMLLYLPLMAVVVGAGPVLGWIANSRSVTYAVFGVELVVALMIYGLTLGNVGNLMEGRAESFLQSLVARK